MSLLSPSALLVLARSLTYTTTPVPSLRASRSNRLINPRDHCITEDAYRYHVASTGCGRRVGPGGEARGKLAAGAAGSDDNSSSGSTTSDGDGDGGIANLSDEVLLARFTRGFFGGTVFWPERLALSVLGKWGMIGSMDFLEDVGDENNGKEKEENDYAVAVWTPEELPDSKLLPRGSTVFGAFQVTNSHLVPSSGSSSSASSADDCSYVDFSFGTSRFAGCHRFSVHRCRQRRSRRGDRDESEGQDDAVEVRFTHFHCDPTRGTRPPLGYYLNWFHQPYARMLIADGLRVVWEA